MKNLPVIWVYGKNEKTAFYKIHVEQVSDDEGWTLGL